jgi:secreted trypsin-like serine protease
MAGMLSSLGAVGQPLAQGSRSRSQAPHARASIVRGTDASITEFPFQVALYNPRAASPARGFFCGGVILDATHVATAAHCLVNQAGVHNVPRRIEVLAGSTYLEPPDPTSVRDPVATTTIDSRYAPGTSDYDVGLLSLVRPLWSGQTPAVDGIGTIAPLPLDAPLAALRSASMLAAEPSISLPSATVSGWGEENPQPGAAPSYPRRLRKALVALVPTALCREEYAGIEQPITPRMLCAGGALPEGPGNADSCYGDSGGPLVAEAQPGAGRPAGDVLLGLVDYGNGCGQAGYAGVYVRVADPAIASFLRVNPPQALAGGLRHGACPATLHAARDTHRRHSSSHRKRRCRA